MDSHLNNDGYLIFIMNMYLYGVSLTKYIPRILVTPGWEANLELCSVLFTTHETIKIP
mgnify:CR=1 FL=1